jgi:hypothetical protein
MRDAIGGKQGGKQGCEEGLDEGLMAYAWQSVAISAISGN